MESIQYLAQIVLGLCLITLIVIQSKGTGLGRTFASNNYHAKRGVEKTVFYSTIIIAIFFLSISILIAF
ncbi:MAG: preprotein translocase subunit SecG [Candidatus Moraniibacteriota bacterium]|nr:MAG: preprotein translocase subunit SecG [Candidatus Moranbacteria bacterium]